MSEKCRELETAKRIHDLAWKHLQGGKKKQHNFQRDCVIIPYLMPVNLMFYKYSEKIIVSKGLKKKYSKTMSNELLHTVKISVVLCIAFKKNILTEIDYLTDSVYIYIYSKQNI